jgi:predicted RNA-binding Zn ribbon-like protein
LLDSSAALAEWAAACGLFDEAAMRRFRAAWSSTKVGSNALEAAHGLRAELQKILQRILAGKPYADLAATTLEPYLAKMLLRRIPVVEKGKLQARLAAADTIDPTDEFLGAVASSALDLFVQVEPEHVRKCASPDCVVVFHDTTKNHRRQWCCMEVCGNRAKAARFRDRHS